jgi:hypothetical protein
MFFVGGIATLTFVVGIYCVGVNSGRLEVQEEFDAYKVQQQALLEQARERTEEKERRAETATVKIVRDTAHAYKAIDTRRRVVLERVRDNSDTSGSELSDDAAVSVTADSESGLAGGDGAIAWLIDYAADAARLEAALNACVTQYEAVKEAFR